MVGSSRRALFVLLAILSLGVIGAGIAWACTPQATLSQPSPESAQPGDAVTLTGQGFTREQPVRIRWNGEEGQLLATVRADANEAFTATVRVPQGVAPGTYVFYAEPTKEPAYATSVAFTVAAPQSQSPAPAPGAGAPAQQPAAEPQGATPQPAGQPARRPAEQRPARRPARTREPARRPDRAPAARRPAPAAATPAAPVAAAPAVTPTGEPAFTGATAAPAKREPAARPRSAARRPASRPEPAQPSQSSATGDLWSGFSTGSDRPSLAATAPSASPAPALTYGLLLLALGIATMAGGLGTVALRRRRLANQREH